MIRGLLLSSWALAVAVRANTNILQDTPQQIQSAANSNPYALHLTSTPYVPSKDVILSERSSIDVYDDIFNGLDDVLHRRQVGKPPPPTEPANPNAKPDDLRRTQPGAELATTSVSSGSAAATAASTLARTTTSSSGSGATAATGLGVRPTQVSAASAKDIVRMEVLLVSILSVFLLGSK